MKRCWVAIATLAVLGAFGALAQTFAPAPTDSIVMPRLEIEDHEDGPMFSAAVAAVAAPSAPTPPGTPSMWFDGSDIDGDGTYNSAYTDGDPITTWVDKGSLGADATQATAGAKPTYRSGGGPGAEDAIEFDGGDYLITSAIPTATQPNQYAITVQWTSVGVTQQIAFDGRTASDRNLFDENIGSLRAFAGSVVTLGSATLNQWEAAVLTYDGASSSFDISGTSYTGNPGPESITGLAIGSRFSGSNNMIGSIGDLIFYDVPENDAQIKTYLAAKHGVTFPVP